MQVLCCWKQPPGSPRLVVPRPRVHTSSAIAVNVAPTKAFDQTWTLPPPAPFEDCRRHSAKKSMRLLLRGSSVRRRKTIVSSNGQAKSPKILSRLGPWYDPQPDPPPIYELPDPMMPRSQPMGHHLSYPIPKAQGPYCQRRPTLTEILADEAPAPWSLSAFKAYSEQMLSSENIEFVLDARAYENKYHEVYGTNPKHPRAADVAEVEALAASWLRILELYLVQNGPQEVNLPADVRDAIVALPNSNIPPHPTVLTAAVTMTKELIQDSILMPFINDIRFVDASDDLSGYDVDKVDDRRIKAHTMFVPNSPRSHDGSPPNPPNGFQHRSHHTSSTPALPFVPINRPKSLFSSSKDSHSSNDSGEFALTDDGSMSMHSPATTHTNTTTHSDAMMSASSVKRTGSRNRSHGNPFKKVSTKLGLSKKDSHSSSMSSRSRPHGLLPEE